MKKIICIALTLLLTFSSVFCGFSTVSAADKDTLIIHPALFNRDSYRSTEDSRWYYSENRLRLTGYVMLEKLVVDAARHASYFTLSRKDLRRFNFVKGDAEGLVNMPLQIKGLKLSVSLREDTEKDNLIWVSLRSVDDFPCNKVAEQFFNGGGHLNASGGRLYCSMDEAVKVVQQAFLHFEGMLKL